MLTSFVARRPLHQAARLHMRADAPRQADVGAGLSRLLPVLPERNARMLFDQR